MGRQSSEIVGNEAVTKAAGNEALSAFANSPDLVTGLKQKTGAEEIVADGYFSPPGPGYVNRPRTNLDDVRDLQNQQTQCNQPKDTPAPAPAPTPVADTGCPTRCDGVQVPQGYQVINQPLTAGQVMKDKDPNNWQDAANQTSSKIMSDTLNYNSTNAEDARGKTLQNSRYEAETKQYELNSQHAREQDAKDRGANRFATKVGAVGNFVQQVGNGAYPVLMGTSSIVYSSNMGRGRGGYGYGGGWGGGYGGGMCGPYGGPMLGGGGWGGGYGGFGGGYGYGYPARGFYGAPMIPYGNTSIYYNGGINFPPQGSFNSPTQPMDNPKPTGTAPYRKCDQICDPKQPQQPEYNYPNRKR